jgi:cellulose synthase (UDP-forming)
MNSTSQEDERGHHISSATLTLLLLFGAGGVLYYLSYLLSPANRGDFVPYLFIVIAESTIIFQALMTYWTILAGGYNPKDFRYFNARQNLFKLEADEAAATNTQLYIKGKKVKVAVLITVFGEPIETIRDTAIAARDIVGLHETYILDDGCSTEVERLAARIGVQYIARESSEGAKAGNINNGLKQIECDYFVIFDADHTPKPGFLQETMPFFASSKVAFVQTPQFYINTGSPIARGAAFAQQLFYRFICTGKNRFNAVFCVGTNVAFRRSAVDKIGGIYQDSKSEDIWTSLLLHELGYRSVFIPDILAEGQAPETIAAYTKQQLRWATGGFEILISHNPLRSKKLAFDQKMQYLATVTFYLLGFAMALLIMVPPLAIFLDLTPVYVSTSFFDWFAHYAAFYGFYFGITLYCMGGLKIETIILAAGSFPTYIKAFWNALISRSVRWSATNQRVSESPFNYLVPQILVFLFLTFASIVGVAQTLNGQPLSLALFWNIANALIFGQYIRMALQAKTTTTSKEKPAQEEREPQKAVETGGII